MAKYRVLIAESVERYLDKLDKDESQNTKTA